MRFSNKRGRPKKNKIELDFGTIELQEKRKSNLSDDLLITLKKLNFINDVEYQAALWFRYLYSIKFGNPNVITACNIMKINGRNLFEMNKEKREKMEKLYNKISQQLEGRGMKNMMLNVCVFDKCDMILKLNCNKYCKKLKEGLEIIRTSQK